MKSSVKVTSGSAGLYQRVQARGHVFYADEPVSLGGADSGPTPFELLLSSLGACIAITIRLYSLRKGWDVESIAVSLEHEKISIASEGEGDVRTAQHDRITKHIELKGSLDETQTAKLLEIAQRCPVHKMLSQGVEIRDSQV